jgi:FkbM family methyltransferase
VRSALAALGRTLETIDTPARRHPALQRSPYWAARIDLTMVPRRTTGAPRARLVRLIAPLLKRFPPWWKVRAYARLSGAPFRQGGHGGEIVRENVSPHDYAMDLRLDDWMERFALLVGCYYEIDATATLQKLLRPGDYFVDIGANVGFLALTASKIIGPQGRVIAFEPNPTVLKRLTTTLVQNEIRNVTVHNCALGDADGVAKLSVGEHSGVANLRQQADDGVQVLVRRADALLGAVPVDTCVLVKLDVEGYELRALYGARSLIHRPRTAFFVEVTDEWLRAAGGSADELFDLLRQAGYSAYIPRLDWRSRLQLTAISAAEKSRHQYDVLFVRQCDGWFMRDEH